MIFTEKKGYIDVITEDLNCRLHKAARTFWRSFPDPNTWISFTSVRSRIGFMFVWVRRSALPSIHRLQLRVREEEPMDFDAATMLNEMGFFNQE